MQGLFVSGYDVLMVIWGVVFMCGAAGFLLAMNRIFQSEERLQDGSRDLATHPVPPIARPLHPAA